MANDVVFKSKAFGGFDKNEVMDFVNKILAEKSALEKKVSEVNIKYAQANAELFELKRLTDEISSEKEELESVKSRLEEALSSLDAKNTEIESLSAQVTEKDNEIEALKNTLSECKVSDDVQAEIDTLRAEVARLKVETEKKRDLERQVGAAMLDARIHSEELVEEAKEKANAVTKSVYSAIGDTALKIDDLSTGISEIARGFTKAVEEVELRIKALTGDMSKTAQLLISESGVISENADSQKTVEYDFTPVDSDISINPKDYGVEGVSSIDFKDSQDEE